MKDTGLSISESVEDGISIEGLEKKDVEEILRSLEKANTDSSLHLHYRIKNLYLYTSSFVREHDGNQSDYEKASEALASIGFSELSLGVMSYYEMLFHSETWTPRLEEDLESMGLYRKLLFNFGPEEHSVTWGLFKGNNKYEFLSGFPFKFSVETSIDRHDPHLTQLVSKDVASNFKEVMKNLGINQQ